MFAFVRAWNLIVLAMVFFYLLYMLWFVVSLSIDQAVMFTLNGMPYTFYKVFRGAITVHLLLTYIYFARHCVVAQREESSRIVTRG